MGWGGLIKKHCPDAVVIVVTNPLDAMAQVMLQATDFPRQRVLGQAGVVLRQVRQDGFGESKGIKGVGLVMYGANAWATRRPVKSLADFKGLKVRVLASQMHTVPLERIGATGVPMIPSEAVQAIASGAIDGNRTGMTLFIAFKYYDIVKNVTQVDGDGMIFSMFYLSKKWFDGLPKDVQQLVLDTSKTLEPEMNQYSIDRHRVRTGR